jgi:hypothetical protein
MGVVIGIIHTISHIAIGEMDFNTEQRIIGLASGDIDFIVEIHRRSRLEF